MTIGELIKELEKLRDEHGPDVKVVKSGRPVNGVPHYNHLRKVRVVGPGKAVWDDFCNGTRNETKMVML